jgi:perosamine synthetase
VIKADFEFPAHDVELTAEDAEAVADVVRSGWPSFRNSVVREFETQFAAWLGVEDALMTCNGSLAQEMALRVAGVRPGDRVVVPAFCYVAVPAAVSHLGARPVFADVRVHDWALDVVDALARASPDAKAVVAVHPFGAPVDVRRLREACDERGLALVENCCEALGGGFGGRRLGAWGHVSVFSFFANKTVSAGEGGMLCGPRELVDRARHLSCQAHRPDVADYWHDAAGWNCRPTAMQAALALSQFRHLPLILERKRAVRSWYGFPKHAGVEKQGCLYDGEHGVWAVGVRLHHKYDVERVRAGLRGAGVDARRLWTPGPMLPPWTEDDVHGKWPNAEYLYDTCLSLPSSTRLTHDDVREICRRLNAVLDGLTPDVAGLMRRCPPKHPGPAA